MNANLLASDSDELALTELLPENVDDLIQDLELTGLFRTMSGGDEFLFEVAKRVSLTSLTDLDTIRYRQEILTDFLAAPELLRQLYEITTEAIIGERRNYRGVLTSKSPSYSLRRSIEVLELFVDKLRHLRRLLEQTSDAFSSPGLKAFSAMAAEELSEDYLGEISEHLDRLRLAKGSLISAVLGPANKGRRYVLRAPGKDKAGLFGRLGLRRWPHTVVVAPRDEAGAHTLTQLNDRGLNSVANALAQSSDHILGFFKMLRIELGFYLGALNLSIALSDLDEPTCLPEPFAPETRVLSYRGLYDPCLALGSKRPVVGNDAEGDGKSLIVITGANSGGKSTFLRSLGVAQVMTQAGLFVAASSFRTTVATRLFTHFVREEDTTFTSGKLDEELARMSEIADLVRANSLVLFNESFSATNEREGSEIGRQIVHALLEQKVRVAFVTHRYTLAHGLFEDYEDEALCLRAGREENGRRSYALYVGEPLRTSFGEDVFEKVFGEPVNKRQSEHGARR